MENDQKYLTKNRDNFNKDLLDFISIPSIAALPEHAEDVQRAAVWLKDRMFKAGIENVEIMDTGGQPAVYGDWLHAGSDKPTALIYGHFDVQPEDPLDLRNIDHFKPIIKDNKIYGRGASDDKGSMFIPIVVFESIFRTSDAFLIKKIILCGITASPPNRGIYKSSLGATKSVEWEYRNDKIEAIKQLKDQKNYI